MTVLRRACLGFGFTLGLALSACSTSGSTWISQPIKEPEDDYGSGVVAPEDESYKPSAGRFAVQVIGSEQEQPDMRAQRIEGERLQGQVLGLFRNTYYDFPSETEFTGKLVNVYSGNCDVIDRVPRPFFEAVCVQGSGLLKSGQTISFARRNCACADICPRTGHRICYDALDNARYPWGRGALGKAITPLLTVAVDDKVIPMGTPVYIPEYDGLPRDVAGDALHDGCFIAQDRGSRVVGRHVDVFTGYGALTALWNRLVPSNRGVTVVVDSPRCARAAR